MVALLDNFGGHIFYPHSSGGGWLNNDWFEHARLRGGSLLWTEDWLDDGTHHLSTWFPDRGKLDRLTENSLCFYEIG